MALRFVLLGVSWLESKVNMYSQKKQVQEAHFVIQGDIALVRILYGGLIRVLQML